MTHCYCQRERERNGDIASLNDEEVGLQKYIVLGGDREMDQ